MAKLAQALQHAQDNPVWLTSFIVLVVTTGWLSFKRAQFKHLATTTAQLPESDRLKAIRLQFKTEPKHGVTAEEWLRARSQTFLFLGFLAALFALLVMGMTAWGAAPRGAQLAGQYAKLDRDMEAYLVKASDLTYEYKTRGPLIVDGNREAEAQLADSIRAYNRAFETLNANRRIRITDLSTQVRPDSELLARAKGLYFKLLTEVHRYVLLGFNELASDMDRLMNAADSPQTREERATMKGKIAEKVREAEDELAKAKEHLNGLREQAP